jgi:hypothetical protein
MTKESSLLICVALLGAWNAGVVWLAQVSGYPLWSHLGAGEFRRFYEPWAAGERALIFIPLILALLGSIAALCFRANAAPAWPLWLGFALQFAVVLLTVLWWSPSASAIVTVDGSLNLDAYANLLHSHWLRVALVTVSEILSCWLLGNHLWLRQAGPHASQWTLLATTACGFYGAGQIWMVQLLCYRVWPSISKTSFYGYHIAWWHSIWTAIFIPAGLVLIGAVSMIWLRPPHSSARLLWTGLCVQALLYLLTAIWWGPLMSRLATTENGLILANYHLLMTTHWLRVAIVSAYAAVALLTLVQAASPSPIQATPATAATLSTQPGTQ